ncbi:hypothetical protein PVT71_10770 [Salipiger sp. H15]|uniref:Tetratricopeptide repeat protein n=1 Tax=Alloyangia sp. H15 TaxID=3029062 RepID=A0AAU8AE12_9RHOB
MARDTVPAAEDVRRELADILASSDFEASERNRRFLAHIVEETLAGRAERIKAYSIATVVFGRGEDFDAQQDPIVRIEAARLRRALESYYLRHPPARAITISIPKGAYVPEFCGSLPEHAATAGPEVRIEEAAPLVLHLSTPRILVETFDQIGSSDGFPTLGRSLTLQLVAALTRFTEIFVYGFDTTEMLDHRSGALAIDYRLGGTIVISSDALRTDLLLQNAEDGRYVWAHSVERALETACEPSRVIGLCAEIAGHVARILALRDGILDSQARESAGDAPLHFAGYQKLLDFQDYWRTLDPDRFEPLRQDLEATIAGDPRFAAAHACLSMVYSNAARYGYTLAEIRDPPLERAMDLARRAIQLAPNSSRAYHARAVAEWFSGQPEASIATLQVARSLNPNDPELLAELGFRSAMRMDWSAAVPLIEEAYRRNPLQSGQYRMGLFFYHFAEGRFDKALQATAEIRAPGLGVVHAAAAAALVRMGRQKEALARLEEAERLSPALRPMLRADLAFRQIHPELVEKIVSAIQDVDPGWARGAGRGPRRSR